LSRCRSSASSPRALSAAVAFQWIIAAQAVGAFVAGALIGALGRRAVLNAVLVVAFFVGPWTPQIRTLGESPRPFILSIDWQLFIPVGYAALSVVGIIIAVAGRRWRLRAMR
jgi:hypothetical protein